MKTRDRILLTSLCLFNEEGEQNVTTVDIANEMDISPGNLYYHFKGKESIIEALYAQFDHQLSLLLHQSVNDPLNLEEHWLFMYVVFEEVFKFRFFYLNATELMIRYPDIEKKFRRLIKLKLETIRQLCQNLFKHEAVKEQSIDIEWLSEIIGMNIVYWFSYQELLNKKQSKEHLLHRAVYNILKLILPYTGENQPHLEKAVEELYQNTL